MGIFCFPTIIQRGAEEALTLTASGGLSYEWTVDGTIIGTQDEIKITPIKTNDYTVKIISENGCTGRTIFPVHILPAIELSVTSNAPNCENVEGGSISIISPTSIGGNALGSSLSDAPLIFL